MVAMIPDPIRVGTWTDLDAAVIVPDRSRPGSFLILNETAMREDPAREGTFLILSTSVIIPTPQATIDVLYQSRITSWRYEVLAHDTTTGDDTLAGFLDGVTAARIRSSLYTGVKMSATMTVTDLDSAEAGKLAAKDVDHITARIRPVLRIEGLPEMPFGVYVITAAPEDWSAVGRTYRLELHEKSIVLDQDKIDQTFTAGTADPVLAIVQDVVESAGETIAVDGSVTLTLSKPLVWEAGTPKLQIVNDLLDAINYNALWTDASGEFQATPYETPANRSIKYEVLAGIDRELVDGDTSIYLEDWSRDLDSYNVPNKVVAVSSGSGSTEALVGVATNEDPSSPYSQPSRGRWITRTETGVEVPDGDEAAQLAFLEARALRSLIAASSVQAAVTLTHLPVPMRVSDVVRFASVPAGIDARHVVVGFELECAPAGLMRSEMQELVSLGGA
jgi:hypothetical protein